MVTLGAELWRDVLPALDTEPVPIKVEPVIEAPPAARPQWNLERFEQEQIRGLVRQVFFPGWPRPAKQVVFCGIDEQVDTHPVCMQVGKALATHLPAAVAVVEADAAGIDSYGGTTNECGRSVELCASLRTSSRQIQDNLWLVNRQGFTSSRKRREGSTWLRDRMGQLRREFDFAVVQAPPAAIYSDAALLGQFADGVVLVVRANATRKASARKIQELLAAANVRLLGVVLSERTFPVPERLYRSL